jgi:hypothetical protein
MGVVQKSVGSVRQRAGSISGTPTSASGTPRGSCKCCPAPLGTNDCLLECDKCGSTFHHRCAGFDDKAFKAYAAIPSGLLPFYCADCKSLLATLEDRVSALEQQAAATSAPAAPPAAVLDRTFIKDLVTELVQELMPKMMAGAREAAVEALELESKKLNLVVIGLPESDAHGDSNVIAQFCSKMNVNANDIADTFRDGRALDGRPRIMKVKFKNSQSRRSFLTGFRGARDTVANAQRAWVRPDLTYQQRVKDRELRAELSRRRDAGEANIKIHRGEIISSN